MGALQVRRDIIPHRPHAGSTLSVAHGWKPPGHQRSQAGPLTQVKVMLSGWWSVPR